VYSKRSRSIPLAEAAVQIEPSQVVRRQLLQL
jgi:hypothetical protein